MAGLRLVDRYGIVLMQMDVRQMDGFALVISCKMLREIRMEMLIS